MDFEKRFMNLEPLLLQLYEEICDILEHSEEYL